MSEDQMTAANAVDNAWMAKHNRERAAADAAHKSRMARLDRQFWFVLLFIAMPAGIVLGSAVGPALVFLVERTKVPPCPCVQKEVQP